MSDRTTHRLSGTAVLVTGVGGRLGAELVRAFEARGARVTGVGRADFDLGGRELVLEAMERVRPKTIVHAAAWTAVDACEDDPDTAYRINTLGTRNVCEAADAISARVVFVSTDHVFSGERTEPYDEFQEPDPRSVYGRSKLWGERFVQRLGPRHVIVRTSRLFGGAARNYVVSVLERARALAPGEPFVAVSDQLAIPTFVPELASTVAEITEKAGGGIYHLTSSGKPCSWAELARRTIALAGLAVPVREIFSRESPRLAHRPPFGVLMSRVAVLEGIAPLSPWEEALAGYVKTLGAPAPEAKRGRA
ncbi:dTDP-4-dehydrorhamnose reductase [bacterium]|nr:dTDP-4-dehydrorhamnose reductase [bacterium]